MYGLTSLKTVILVVLLIPMDQGVSSATARAPVFSVLQAVRFPVSSELRNVVTAVLHDASICVTGHILRENNAVLKKFCSFLHLNGFGPEYGIKRSKYMPLLS